VVGHNGKIFLDDLRGESDIAIDLPGARCAFHIVPPPKSERHIAQAGSFLCVEAPFDGS
jgi:hypothetical protein